MTRPRDRASAAGLLPRMEARPHSDGNTVTYRYRPIGANPINLGTDRAAALRRVLDMTGDTDGYVHVERGVLPDLHKNRDTTARVYDRNKVVKRSAL